MTRALALALLVALAAPRPAARADDPPTVRLTVGEDSRDLGTMPNCDDLTIVAVKANGRGVRATRPGTTLCSFDAAGGGGIRRVYRIVVTAPRGGGRPPSER